MLCVTSADMLINQSAEELPVSPDPRGGSISQASLTKSARDSEPRVCVIVSKGCLTSTKTLWIEHKLMAGEKSELVKACYAFMKKQYILNRCF